MVGCVGGGWSRESNDFARRYQLATSSYAVAFWVVCVRKGDCRRQGEMMLMEMQGILMRC